MSVVKLTMIAAVCALSVSTAAAQDLPANELDLRCATVGLSLAGSPQSTEQVRGAGTMIAIHYIGKIYGRTPDIDLEAALVRLSESMTPAELDAERIRCGTEFQVLGNALTAMGERMQRRAREQPAN
jgi:hypothetical protein